MKSQQPALRPYLECIAEYCRTLDKESLVQLILFQAKQVTPGERNNFSTNILSFLPKIQQQHSPEGIDDILAKIAELQQEILTRIESIEDGTFWDNPDNEDGWDDSYYLDDDPDILNARQTETLAEYFNSADILFMEGDKHNAQTLYNALFTLIKETEECDYYLPGFDTDLREARSRMVRCIYEIYSGSQRVDSLLKVLLKEQDENIFDIFPSPKTVFLVDMIDADTGELDDFASFLASWYSALSECDFTTTIVADLLLEATFLHKGIDAVGKLAGKWQEKQPRASLYWLQELAKEESWQKLSDISQETLEILPYGRYREIAAHYLVQAGQQLQNNKTILTGYREQFKSKPDISRLLNLVAEAQRQQQRDNELHDICTFLEHTDNTKLLIPALLMNGNIDRAFALSASKNKEPVGWSYNNGPGLLYGSLLYLLSGCNNSCTTILNILESYTASDTVYFDEYESRPVESNTSDFKEILKGLQKTDTTAIDLEQYHKWVMNIGQKRVNHIVSNTHRGAYERAAMTLCSLAEYIAIKEDKNKALHLLTDYCKVRYNRHSAFRREMREVVGQSQILCVMVGGL